MADKISNEDEITVSTVQTVVNSLLTSPSFSILNGKMEEFAKNLEVFDDQIAHLLTNKSGGHDVLQNIIRVWVEKNNSHATFLELNKNLEAVGVGPLKLFSTDNASPAIHGIRFSMPSYRWDISGASQIVQKMHKETCDRLQTDPEGEILSIMEKWFGSEKPAEISDVDWEYLQNLSFFLIAQYGTVDALKVCIKKGIDIDVNMIGDAGNTPIMKTLLDHTVERALEKAQLLLECGADINVVNDHKLNLLHYCCVFSHPETKIKFLLDAGIKTLNSQDVSGMTALHLAVERRQISLTKILKENGSDCNIKDNWGNGPLDIAILQRQENNSLLNLFNIN